MLTGPNDGLVLIKRTRPGREPYWVFPGGGVEDDESPKEAVVREVEEELGAPVGLRLGDLMWMDTTREIRDYQFFFEGDVSGWDPSKRSGPEMEPGGGKGLYEVEEVPAEDIESGLVPVRPPEPAKEWLLRRNLG